MNKRTRTAKAPYQPVVFAVPAQAKWYHGSGQAVAAIKDGAVIDAIYSGVDVEFRDRKALAEKHADAQIVAGMLSCYELTLFDASELR